MIDWQLIIEFIVIDVACFYLSSTCNAVMDKVDHQPQQLPFWHKITGKQKVWWNIKKGWQNKYINRDPARGRVKWNIMGIKINKPVQLTDAWHFFKMLMILFYTYPPAHIIGRLIGEKMSFNALQNAVCIAFVWLIIGIWRNTNFSLWYNKILKK